MLCHTWLIIKVFSLAYFTFSKHLPIEHRDCQKFKSFLMNLCLKVKEVHQVRWMSVFLAVETVYKTLDSLITLFTDDKDAKAKGYGKKMIQHDFIATTYLLMDVWPVVTELCLVFQKADLDVSLVKVSVDHCKKLLNVRYQKWRQSRPSSQVTE